MFLDSAFIGEVGLFSGGFSLARLVSATVSSSSSVFSAGFFFRPDVASVVKMDALSVFYSIFNRGRVNLR